MGICVSCRRRERKAPEKRSVPGAGGPAKGAAAELLPRRLDHLRMMANSMSSYKMTNPLKGIVSKRRKRYMKDGFNLDLAYITDRLIAMGFPAEKLEGVYRNHIDEVYRFLEKKHRDHYKIYNLCSERSYDSSKFHERVERYAFEDHTPPNIELIQPFCEDVDRWLSADTKNVAAVHCKAGKGRTGTMVCCYLLYSRQKTTADEALKFYGTKRTHDEKGVTIPSQRRYVEYYAWLLHSGLQYAPTKVHIRELVMTPPPFQHAGHAVPELLITQAHPFFKAPMGCHEARRTETSLHVHLTHCTPLCGDVRVDVYKHKMKMRKEKLFHFWFNTFFIAAGAGAVTHPPLPDSPNLETFKLTLNKWQLDDAHKDKQHKTYSQDFKVELIVQRMPDSSTFVAGGGARPSPPSSSASSCSEPEPEPDAWDSGERAIPYTRLHSPPCEGHGCTPADTIRDAKGPHGREGSGDGRFYAAEDAKTYRPCRDGRLGPEKDRGTEAGPEETGNGGRHYGPDESSPDELTDSEDIRGMFDRTPGLFDPDERIYERQASAGSHLCGQEANGPFDPDRKLYRAADTGLSEGPDTRRLYNPDGRKHNERDAATINPIYVGRKDIVPTVNPLYCGKGDEQKIYKDKNYTEHKVNYDAEPMEYANDVFSSAPTSARQSPVEECKGKRDDKSKPRLSLDFRASWKEFSGKFASDSRRAKDDS